MDIVHGSGPAITLSDTFSKEGHLIVDNGIIITRMRAIFLAFFDSLGNHFRAIRSIDSPNDLPIQICVRKIKMYVWNLFLNLRLLWLQSQERHRFPCPDFIDIGQRSSIVVTDILWVYSNIWPWRISSSNSSRVRKRLVHPSTSPGRCALSSSIQSIEHSQNPQNLLSNCSFPTPEDWKND